MSAWNTEGIQSTPAEWVHFEMDAEAISLEKPVTWCIYT